jgi:uncharacterized membrane protein (DUF485 family)
MQFQERGKFQRMREVHNLRAGADCLGIGLSFLCLVHCLVFPFLIAFAPELLKGLPGDDLTHRILALVIGLVGWIAFRSGYRIHRRRWVLGIFSSAMVLIAAAAILGESALSVGWETGMTVCGSLLLVTAHFANHTFCRSCTVRDCSHSSLGAKSEGDAIEISREIS